MPTDISQLKLRVTVNPLYITIGTRPITWLEEDQNFIIIGDLIRELQAIGAESGVSSYDAGTTYEGGDEQYVSYSGNLWKFISPTDKTGITPGTDPAVWELSSTGALTHERNKDQYMDFGGPNQVSAAQLKVLLSGSVAVPVYAPLIAKTTTTSSGMPGRGKIVWNANQNTGPITHLYVSCADAAANYLYDKYAETQIGDKIYLHTNSYGIFQRYTVTNIIYNNESINLDDWFDFTVTLDELNGQIFANLETVNLIFSRPESLHVDGTNKMTGPLDLDGNDIKNVQQIKDSSGIQAIRISTVSRLFKDITGAVVASITSIANGFTLSNAGGWGGSFIVNALTGNRNYQLPDKDITFAGVDDVNNAIAGLKFKTEVIAASTANVTVSSAPASLDGISLTIGDRVLLKNQSTATGNGIYIFNGTGTALTRSTDADTGIELANKTVPVNQGTVNADKWFTCTNDSITIGSTSITFTETGGATYTAGTELQLVGTQFSVAPFSSYTPSPGTIGTSDTPKTAIQKLDGNMSAKMQSLSITPVKTANYTGVINELVRTDTTSNNVAVAVPIAPADKTLFAVKQVTKPGAFTTTLNLGGSDKVNTTTGVTSFALSLLSQAVLMEYNATDSTWVVISDDLPLSQLDLRYEALANKATGTGALSTSDTTYPSEKKVKYNTEAGLMALNKEQIGVLFNNDFTSLTPYTKSGTFTGTASGSGTALSGGDASYNNFYYSNYGSSGYVNNKQAINYKPSSSTGAVALGFKTASGVSNASSIYATLVILSATTAQLEFRNVVGTLLKTSDKILTYSSSDTLTMAFEMTEDGVFISLGKSTGKDQISIDFNCQYSFPSGFVEYWCNNYWHTVHQLSGTGTITNHSAYVATYKRPFLLFEGDSIPKGYGCVNRAESMSQIIGSYYNNSVEIHAQPGARVSDINTTEIIAIAPKVILLMIGTNDFAAGDSTATFTTNITAKVTTLQSAGYVLGTTLFIARITPRGSNISGYNGAIDTLAGAGLVDFYTDYTLITGTNIDDLYAQDGLHPNGVMNRMMADKFMSILTPLYPPSTVNLKNKFLVTKDRNQIARLRGVKLESLTTYSDYLASTFPKEGFTSPHVQAYSGVYPTRDMMSGISFINRNNTYKGFGFGCYYDGTNFIATHTSYTIILDGTNGITNVALRVFAGTGATIGSVISLTEIAELTYGGVLNLKAAGGGLGIKGGTNNRLHTFTTNGTTPVVISNNSVTANSVIFMSCKTNGVVANIGYIDYTPSANSVSFVSSNTLDVGRVIDYYVIEKL